MLRYLNIIYLESKSGVSPWRVEAGGLHDQIHIFKSHKGNSTGDGLEEQQTESREPQLGSPAILRLALFTHILQFLLINTHEMTDK